MLDFAHRLFQCGTGAVVTAVEQFNSGFAELVERGATTETQLAGRLDRMVGGYQSTLASLWHEQVVPQTTRDLASALERLDWATGALPGCIALDTLPGEITIPAPPPPRPRERSR